MCKYVYVPRACPIFASIFCIYVAISFGLLGALDDYKKIKHSNSSGISSKLKILIQIILAIIGVSFFVYFVDYQIKFLILYIEYTMSMLR